MPIKGIAKAIADLCPAEVVEKGGTPINNVKGIIHHSWSPVTDLGDRSMDNVRYHLHLSYAGPFMALTALNWVRQKGQAHPMIVRQAVFTLHASGLFGYPWEESARAFMSMARMIIKMRIRVVVLIPDKKKRKDMFQTMWADYVASDRIFNYSGRKSCPRGCGDVVLGRTDQGSMPVVMGMRQRISVAELKSPAYRAKKHKDRGRINSRLNPCILLSQG